MGAAVGVNDVPIVGQPVAFGTGFLVLVFVGFSSFLIFYLTTFAHEGGKMLVGGFLFRGLVGFTIKDETARGSTNWVNKGFVLRQPLINFAGTAAPPLFGLAGAALIADGNAFAVLFSVAFLSAVALLFADNGLARLIPALVIAAVFAAALRGGAENQATLAVTLVWILLLGGLADAWRANTTIDDAKVLSDRLLLPGWFWKLVWITIGVVSLFVGGRLLLVRGA